MRFTLLDDIELDKLPKPMRRAIDQKEKSVRVEKREYEERIRPLLTPALQRLQEIPWAEINDALVRSIKIDPARRKLNLCLFCDHDQAGYYNLHLHYKDVQLSNELSSILCLIAQNKRAQALGHELDVELTEAPVFIHRINWYTGIVTNRTTKGVHYTLTPETEIRFGDIKIKRVASGERWHARRPVKITIVRQTDEVRIAKYLSSAASD